MPAYSTRDDPRMKNVMTWDKEGKDDARRKKSVKEKLRAQRKRLREKNKELKKKIRFRYVSEGRDREKTIAKMDKLRKKWDREREERRRVNALRRKASYTKGSLRYRQGAVDIDPLRSDMWSRVVLDSRCLIYGHGRYEEGKPGEKGRFIPDDTPVSEVPLKTTKEFNKETGKWEERVDVIEDTGPIAIGGSYVRFGKGRPPGVDIRRWHQIPRGHQYKGVGVDSIWRRSNPFDSGYAPEIVNSEAIMDWTVWPRFAHDGEHRG